MSDQDIIKVGQMSIRYLIDGADTGGMGVFELTIPPGSNVPPPHSHSNSDECIHVLSGTLRYSVDGQARDLRPGESGGSVMRSVTRTPSPLGH